MIVVPPCLAQDVAAPSSDTSAEVADENPPSLDQPPAAVFAPADITSKAAEFALWLQQFEATIQPSPIVAQLALEFSQQSQTIAELRSELDSLTAADASARQLEEQRREWRQMSTRIDAWMQRADERWAELRLVRDEIDEVRQRWVRTSEANLEGDLPEEVKQRVDRIVAQVETLQAATRERLDQVADLIKRLADARASTNQALTRLNELTENINRRLVTRDALPLWQTQEAQWLNLNDTTRVTATRWVRDIRSFVVGHPVRVLLHGLLFIALAWVTLVARRASRDWPEDDRAFDRAKFLASRPLAVALVFTILAGYFLYGPLPSAPRDLLYLIVLLPVLYLASGLTDPWERAGMYGLLVLSGLFQFVQFCPEGTLLMRALLLLTQVAAIAITGYAIWQGRALGDQRKTGLSRAAVVFYPVVLLAFVVALLANVLGWVNLTQFLTEGTLLTCKGAILAVLVFRAGSGLLPAVIRHGPGRALLSVRRHAERYDKVGVGLLGLVLLFIWLQQTLRRFRLSEPFANNLEAVLATPLSWAGADLTIGNVVKAVLILIATFYVQRLLRFLLTEELFPRLHAQTSSTAVFATLLKYLIVAAGLGMAGSALGLTATQLTVLFGALGVGIGFGLQNIVNNFVSGLILMFERPIKVGDIVEVGGNWGKIKGIGVRATSVDLFEGAELVVPNGDLISKEVKNWTLSNTTARVELLVGVAYGSDAREVLNILVREAKRIELVYVDPEPFAMMYEFGESSLNFRLLCWTSIDNRGVVISQVHVAVYEALNNAGIEIAFPQRDLHLKSTAVTLSEFDRMTRED
jgi:small-conductance mechanosensitive channel